MPFKPLQRLIVVGLVVVGLEAVQTIALIVMAIRG